MQSNPSDRQARPFSSDSEYDFGFGIEAEYLLAEAGSFRPLWYQDVTFTRLNEALESIPLHGLPGLDGLYPNPPHRKIMPFIVEGYHVHDSNNQPIDILPKGLEIRTPKCKTIQKCLRIFELLHERMQEVLRRIDLVAVALSHHPTASHFEGPQEGRDHDFWLWAKQAMVTYGPDLNVSLPRALQERLDLNELEAKVDYYAPGLTALSLASPFYEGKLWEPPGRRQFGRAVRTFKRSIVAPPIELHPEQGWRLEFKPFEMSCHVKDYHCFFLLWLELLLDDGLKGRATKHTRIYDLGAVSQTGLQEEYIRNRIHEVLEGAFRNLPKWGFNPSVLESMVRRVEEKRTPADEIIEHYEAHHSLETILRNRAKLVPERPQASDLPGPSAWEASAFAVGR